MTPDIFYFEELMPHTKSAWKRLRSSEKRRRRNRVTTKNIKLQSRKVADAIHAGDATVATTEAKMAAKKLDKAASRGVIHKNKAARLKSNMARKINAVKAKAAAPAAK